MHRLMTILLAVALDLLFGDPPNRAHPVVLMGNWLSLGRRQAPARRRFWFGAGWLLAGIALFALPWRVLQSTIFDLRLLRSSPHVILRSEATKNPPDFLIATHRLGGFLGKKRLEMTWLSRNLRLTSYALLSAIPLKLVLAYRNLRGAARQVQVALAADDLPEARRLLSWHLVSRETSDLSAAEVAGATIESLAENLTDSLTAPLLAFALGGLPAAWGYRLVNTADAMWGYRTAEFEQLGKFAARLDDALNWLPARLTGWLLVASAGLVGGDAGQAARVMLAQHARTASPNAGWTMSAAAGALGVTLTKRDVYALEGGHGPLDANTIDRAIRLTDVCVGLVVLVAGIVAVWRGITRR